MGNINNVILFGIVYKGCVCVCIYFGGDGCFVIIILYV